MRFTLFILFLFFASTLVARDTLRLSKAEAEAIFIENNLALIAENLQIEREKAEVIQAKLWPNPFFSVSEINAWATTRQTGGETVSPPFWGDFGRNQQIAFELEQLVQTAGKRKKLLAIKQLDVSRSEQYFRELLRGLKYELRILLTELQYLQRSRLAHESLLSSLAQLSSAYSNQLVGGHVSQAEFVRLRAMEMEIQKAVLGIDAQLLEGQKEVTMLLQLDPTVQIELSDAGFIRDVEPYTGLFVDELLEAAKTSRPDFQLALLSEQQQGGQLAYERAKRVPDLAVHANYDRNGNTMRDFVGFGVTFDLPIFDRNQGNIKKAKLGIERAKVETRATVLAIEREVVLAYDNLVRYIQFAETIEPGYEGVLDSLLETYTTNFSMRRISMLEYVDFLQAYLENKELMLDTYKAINQQIEELNFALGRDLSDLP